MSIFNKYGPKGRQPEYLETDENEEIAMLHRRIMDEAPAPGSQLSRLLLYFTVFYSTLLYTTFSMSVSGQYKLR